MRKKINMKQIVAKAKTMLDQHTVVTKRTKDKVYFKVNTFKGVYNNDMSKAPQWFQEFADEQRAFNKKQEAFNKKQEAFNKEMLDFKSTMIKRTTSNLLDLRHKNQFVKSQVNS